MGPIAINPTDLIRDAQKSSDNWNTAQRVAAFLILAWAAVLFLTGQVAGGQEVAVVLAVGLLITGLGFLRFGRGLLYPPTLAIQDKQGRFRGVLTTHEGRAFLGLFSESGDASAIIAADEGKSSIALSVGGQQRVVIGSVPDGSSMSLRRSTDEGELQLTTSDGDGPSITLIGRDKYAGSEVTVVPFGVFARVSGDDVATLYSHEEGGGIAVNSRPAGMTINATADQKEGPGLVVGTRDGSLMIAGRVEPSLVLLDANAQPVREATWTKVDSIRRKP